MIKQTEQNFSVQFCKSNVIINFKIEIDAKDFWGATSPE